MPTPHLLDFRSDRSTYVSGDVAVISARFDIPVFVDDFQGFRVPVLVLSNGARAFYVGGSGTDELRFQYNVTDVDRSTSDLTVVAFAENDATIRDKVTGGDDANVTVRFNDVGTFVANNDILTPSSVGDVSVQTQSLSTGADLVNPKIASMSSVSGAYGVGTTLDIVVSFDEIVLVRTSGGVPTLQFTGNGQVLDGFAASYVGGSGTKKLTFRVDIAEGMPSASALDVIDLALNGGLITDLSGNEANLGITAGTNNLAPYADIQVDGSSLGEGEVTQPGGGSGSTDVTPAFVESVQSIDGDGPFDVGDHVDLKVTLSEAVTLNTSLGAPILALSNGGMAQYISGSGSRELLFRYTVKASDRNTQDLDIIGVAENDASIVDAAGNRTDVRINGDNRLAKFGNVVIDAQAPYLRSVDAADDTYIVGDKITFTGTFSEAVQVEGTPSLALSNGGFARYVSGTGSSLLVFEYTVAATAQSSSDLDVLGLSIDSGSLKSAVTGNAATTSVAAGILSFDADVLIDTSRPSGTISIDKSSLIANETASVTVTFDEEVEDPRGAISVLNGTLSDLVGGDETGAPSRVWTGSFTPALGVEDATNALILDNTKVFDTSGNAGIGLSASENFLIDTRGPAPFVTSSAQADGSRLLTLDFGETVTDLSVNGLVVSNGVKGDLTKLSETKYTLSVTPEVANPSGLIGLSLADNIIQDALGNFNDPFTASFVWDETAPVIEAVTLITADGSSSASYTTGDAINIAVRFDEPVEVTPVSSDASLNPMLALSNGQVAHYVSGSQSNVLTFRYIVQQGDEASDLDSLALVENAARIHDVSGNDALVRIQPGSNNLAFGANIVIDGVVPSITNVSAPDGLYQAGDEILLDVQFSEDVTLDRSGGDPILALSNGSYAEFVSHDGDRMVFSYAIATGDNDAQDLDVLGFAENGSSIVDASGNRANVAIRFGINNLAERNEVNIDAARPQIADTSANAGEYKAGQQIEIALAMSKGVVVDTTQGDPSLKLNNGREAVFDAGSSTPTKLVFTYDVLATDVLEDGSSLLEEYDLSIASFEYNNAEIRSLIGGASAEMMLPLSGLSSEAVHVDLTLPEVVSISLSDTALSAGEDAEVTVVLSEAVRQLDTSYFTVEHGGLSSFESDDNITWRATYTPVRDVDADDLVVRLDASRLSDAAGNLGLGIARSASYDLDSTYPEVEIRSDVVGIAREAVRFTVNFTEAVTGFDEADLKVVNGTIVPFSFNGSNAEGEYSVMVEPLAQSRQPIKVSVEGGVAHDGAGNGNRASLVFVQPVDTAPPAIEQIEGAEGSYALGDVVQIDVTFTEAVTLQLEPELSEHVLPHLALNNGQEARYVTGSGGDVWTFEYVVSTPDDVTQLVDRETLKVLGLVENDTSLLDAAGNKLEDYFVEGSNQLNAGLSVDTTGAVITGFSSVDGTYKTDDVLYIHAHLSELVRVNGVPTLELSNGGRAEYLSGGGSSRLTFRYIVDEADGNTSDLSVVSVGVVGATLLDRAGNETDVSVVSGENDLGAAHTIVVDTEAPELTGVRLVEDAGTASDVVNDGYYKAGTVLAFEVDFDDAVSVDVSGGAPILTLSNGSTAQYVGYVQQDDGTDSGVLVDDLTKLRFEYTVQQDDINTRELNVTGLAERGAKITDQAGNEALVEINPDQLNYTTAVVDTQDPTEEMSSDTFAANSDGDDLVRELQTVTFTFKAKEAIEFDLSSIDYDTLNAQTREDLGLEADVSDEELTAARNDSIYVAEQRVMLEGFTVGFEGSRADENGIDLSEPYDDLSATNLRWGSSGDGDEDGSTFMVDVDVPDRSMGNLTVTVLPNALRDLATNENSVAFSHSQEVDTQTVALEVTPSAGLFIGSDSEVRLFDQIGQELAASTALDPATGQVTITVLPNETYPNGYRGPVLVEVRDNDPDPDYIDEFTGEGVSLSDGTADYVMRAVLNVTEPGETSVTVSPVTEIAVTKLFEGLNGGSLSVDAPILETEVDAFNVGIGKIFGIEDIVKTKATVVNSAMVEQITGVDVADFDLTDGVSAAEKYGQVLAMLSARDSESGSLGQTVTELAAEIKAISSSDPSRPTVLAIKQAGADKLAAALSVSTADTALDNAGVNRSLLDVAYIDEADASGFGLNLAEAETATVPVKGAKVGDIAFIQWGVITQPDLEAGEVAGAPNRFEVVIDATHIQADGSIRVAVPLSVIEKQGDATEVAVSTAVIPAGTTDVDGNPVTAPLESDYRAPVLLTVDIIPPQTTVEAPDASTPFTTVGAVEGIRGGDDLNVLLNNSADDHLKYALSTEFLSAYEVAYQEAYDAALIANPSATVAERKTVADAAGMSAIADQVPTGLSVSNIVQDPASGTWQFDWNLDLTTAISVAEEAAVAAAVEAGESYTPVPTFTPDDEKAVFQVQASTADLVGNADADDARNTVIIGSVDDVVDTVEEKAIMDQALNRLSERFGDAAVDTRAEIKVIAEAIDGINTLKAGVDTATIATDLVVAEQRLILGTGASAGSAGAVAAGVHSLAIGEDSFTIDLSAVGSPTVDNIIAAITSDPAYAAAAYTVESDASGNGLDIVWKSFGPQPDVVASVEVTSMERADQLSGTISNPGGLVSFAVQDIPVEGEVVDGAFVPSKGGITVGFGGVDLTVAVSEGETLADALVGLQSDDNYAALPFRLAVNAQGDGFVATWKATQTDPVTEQITVDRSYEVTTTTETTADSVVAGTAGVTTQELQSLDIQNVDDRDMAAVNRVLASDLAQASAPTVSFDQSALAAGETSRVSMTFATRVGQIPDDALALVGGSLSTEGDVDDPVWSSSDGLTWTATFTASSLIPNTAFSYTEELDARGDVVVDEAGTPVLVATVTDDTTNPVTYAGVATGISQIAMTEALVNRVSVATNKVANFASEQDGFPAPMPSVQDFADMAVAGVDGTNLSAVNDALLTIRDRFETAGDLHTQMNRVVESYNAVFDTVLAPTGVTQPLAADLVEDFKNLGVSNLSSDSARAEEQLTLLQGALQAIAAAKSDIANDDGTTTTAADQQVDMINSVAKLESFAGSVEKVLARSNGESIDIDGTATPIEVSVDDFTALGFENLLADTSANSRLSSLQKVLLDQSEGTGSAAVVSYADLKSVLEEASNSFDAIVGLSSAAQDTSYVDETARSAAVSAALAAVDADNFQSMGVDGVTDVAIGSLTAAAMSDAVKDALANTENSIDDLEAIQKVVDSYTQVLSVASGDVTGATAVISDAEFVDLGVNLANSDAEEPADVAHLLSGVIANKAAPASGATTDNVDSVAEVQALADAAKRVFDNANQTSDDGGANASEADLNTLGFDAVDADNIDAIQRVLTRTSDRDGVVDYTDLKAKVDAAVDAHTALTAVVAVAQGNATPDLSGLDETTFADMGVDHVTAGNVAAMLDALSNVNRAIDTAVDVQTVVDSYNVLLDLGSYDSSDTDATVPASATATDLTNIGVELETGTEDAVAELVSGIVSNLALDAVDTVAEAQAIVDAIDAVFANTLRSGEDDTTHIVVASKDQLHTLGFASVTDDNLDAVQRVLSDQTDESDVKSYTDLKSLIDAAVTAHADVLNAASTDDLTGIDETDYAAMGIDGVDGTNIASINDALINTANALSTAATVQEVVDSYNHILDLRDAGTGITLDAADFMDLGVTLKAAGGEQDQQVAYLQEVVAKELGNGDITTVSGLQDLANATSDLIDLIQGNSPDSDGVDGLTVAQLALLGVTAADAEEAGMISARLARTADDISDVTDLETDLTARVQEARDALAKIRSYAEGDGVSDADADGTSSPADPDDIPTPDDFLNIGVNGYAVQKTVNDTLTAAGGSLVLDGMVEEKSYHFDDYNMIEKFRSTSDDPSQESYYLLDLTKDGTIGSADADVKDNVNFNPAGGFGGYWTSYWVGNVDEVKQLLQNNADLQVEGVYYDVGLGTGGGGSSIVVSWQNGQPVSEVVTIDTPRVYIVQPGDPTQWATSITTSGASYTAGRGDVHVFDISHASFDGVTFGLTDPNGDQSALLTLTGTPGQAGASLSVSIPSNQSDDLTLTTSTSGTFALSVVDGTVVPIDTSNIASINELFAATVVGADAGDDPATVRSEIQYVIDQNVGRLGALAKISAYAQANVPTPSDNTLIPDAADFAAAGVSGVTDANNIPALLVKLASLGTSSNAAAADTAAELQGFVKQVAIEKVKAWTDTDGGNGSAPILQDYLNADLISYDDAAITEAMVPSLNELFAGSLTSAGDADDQTEQQAVIDGAASLLAAMAKIADYADADGAIDLDNDANTGGANGYDQLTVADFEAAGISGVGDGTNVSTGSGTSASSTYNNLEAVLSKLAQSDIAYLNADTVGEVQQLVADVAVEKINSYADADGVLGLVNETITVYVDVKTPDHPVQGGSTNAFYLDNVEAPALDLKAGTYTFDQSEPSNATHPLNIYANGDKSGALPAGITVTQTGTPGQAGAQTVVVIDADFSGTVSYQCESHEYMGNSAEVEMPYFTPELQDYTNAGLVEDSTAGSPVAINTNQVPFVNALLARSDVGGTLAKSDTYHADTQANQQDAIDQFGASMLALEKFVDYMLTENSMVKADFTAQDFVDAGLARVDGTNYSAILDHLPGYETSDTLVRNDLDSVERIQAFVSRAIIAEYNADQANQAPVGDDYVAAGITGADADNAAAMNYQVANNGAYADTIAALEGLVTPAEAAITKLATDDLSHIEPISNDSQITIGRSHDGSSFVPHALELSHFGDYADPSLDALASIKITTLPSQGVLYSSSSEIYSVAQTISGTEPVVTQQADWNIRSGNDLFMPVGTNVGNFYLSGSSGTSAPYTRNLNNLTVLQETESVLEFYVWEEVVTSEGSFFEWVYAKYEKDADGNVTMVAPDLSNATQAGLGGNNYLPQNDVWGFAKSIDNLGMHEVTIVPLGDYGGLNFGTLINDVPTRYVPEVIQGDYEVQTIDVSNLLANAEYIFEIGARTVTVTTTATTSVSDFASIVDSAFSDAGINVSVTSNGTSILLNWNEIGVVEELVNIGVTRALVNVGDIISAQDINDGNLTYTPADTTGAVSLEYAVIDDQGNESAVDYTLSIDRLDASPATGIANSGLLQTDVAVYSSPVYVGDALTGFDGMSSLRVAISATGGNVKINSADLSASGATQITTGFDFATSGGDEICIEGTEAQINAALKALRTQITSGQEKVDISIDVQPGGMVYNPENGHFYEYVASSGVTWTNAKTAAEGRTFEGMTGYLATPTSAEENAFIASKVNAQAWIGAGDPNTEGKWEWLTGPEAGTQFWSGAASGSSVGGEYVNWASGEPNDSGGEDYAHYLTGGQWNDYRANNGSIQGYMVEYGGMSGDVSTVKSGVRTLTVYATEALGNVDMTLADFAQAGVTGVTADNLASVNQVLSTKSAADTDTNPKLQSIIDDTIAAIAKIEDYNNAANGVTSLDETDYAAAGITGVTADNFAAINTAVAALATGGADTTSEIQAVVSQVRIEAYADATASTTPMPEAPTVADYHALGIYSVDASNISGVNAFVFDAAAMLAENTTEIALLVQEALELQPLLDAIAKISAYADADGVGVAVPTLDDYVAAQLTGVTQYNVGMANALFADANVGTGDTTSASTQSDQQTVLTAASARLVSYSKIVSYADNDAGPQPTLTDYTNIGLQNFPSDYVSLINAKLVTAGIGIAEVDELSELEAMASQIKVTEYANANGLAADGTTALSGDFVPTINDYANIGVTEIFDGTEMVAVDGSNVEQLNDLMAMRYIGNPDADGDGSTAAQGDTDERVDVVNNATDAATNETNLDYAGTVDTASEIEDVIANAMGDKADADGGTFGLRAAALDKIAAFAQAVNGLADQAAYDTYIADGNNAAGIPNAQDYNAAGVLDLTDSTDGITSALATAINAKLFTGGATSAVNTVAELQPYVDSANTIVDKIGAWAEPDWSGIGSADSYIVLKPSFENPDFELASGTNVPGWTVVNQQIDLGVTEIAGLITPEDVNQAVGAGNTPGTKPLADEPGGWNGTTSVEAIDTGSNVAIQLDTGNSNLNSYSIVHGPAIYSNGTVKLRSGDSVSIRYKAVAGGDAPDVFGYIQNVDTGDHVTLVDFTGTATADPSWYTAQATLSASEEGEYRFVFIGGTFDYTGGRALGAKFIIDDVLISQPPQKFNGVVSTNDESDYINTQSVFDGEGFVDANSLAFASATTAAVGNEIELGWYDQGDFGFDQAVVDHLIIHPKNAGTDFSKLPTDFDVMGWDNAAGQWEHIKTFSPASVESATVTTIGDTSSNEVQTLIAPEVNDNGYYTLEIGSDRVVVQLDATATIDELATALHVALTAESIGVTVTASGNDLTLTWDAQGTVSDSVKLTAQSVVESSDGKALVFDLSDSTRAYTGFKVVVRDTLGGDGTVEITELDFKAKQVTTAHLPANSEPTFEEYNAIGFPEVTAANVADINALVFAKESAADLATLPQIKSVIDTYLTAMGRIESFANGDGSSDVNLNFTSDSGETGVPTVGDYQAVGLRYVKNSDGLNMPIADANIAAINEVIAQATYGDDSGDTAITTTAELRAVLNSGSVVARLTAIDKISTLATATASSITLSATGFDVETSTNDVVELDLIGPYGAETLSATYNTEFNLTGLLAASLTSDSAYTIAVDGSGNTVISRADGQAFSVVVNAGSVGNWTLTDTADNTRTLSNDNDTLAVAGAGEAITVADFAAAGVSGVTANNVQSTVIDLVAKTQNRDLDTQSEIQAVVDGAVALENIVEYLDDQQLNTPAGVAVPTVDDFATLGITTFGTGSDEESITTDNIGTVLADLVTMGPSIDTTNGGTPAIQGIDKTELTTAVDLLPYAPAPTGPVVTMAMGMAETLNVGSSMSVMMRLNSAPLVDDSQVEVTLNNGGSFIAVPFADNGAVFLVGTYTVALGDSTTSDLQISSFAAVSGKPLPSVDGVPMSLAVPAGLDLSPNMGGGTDPQIEVTDYAPPQFETLIFENDTGLFGDDLVTSDPYQYDASNGAATGTFSPALTSADEFLATYSADPSAYTISEALEAPVNYVATSSLPSALDQFNSPSGNSLWLSKKSSITAWGDPGVNLAANETYTVTLQADGESAVVLTVTPTSSDSAENLVNSLITGEAAQLYDAGFYVTRMNFNPQGSQINRPDGKDFTINLSDNFGSDVRTFDGSTYTPIATGADVTVSNGEELEYSGSFKTAIESAQAAIVTQEGDGNGSSGSVAERQTLVLTLTGSNGVDGVIRIGEKTISISYGNPTSWAQIINNVQGLIDSEFSGSSANKPTISLTGSPTFGANETATVTFTWPVESKVDYVISLNDHTDETYITGSFDYTLDKTAATTPVVSGSVSNAGADVSSSISGVTAGEYVYLIKNDQTTVLNNLISAPQTALDNLRDLSDELWSRSKVASDGSVDLTTLGLVDGIYSVVAMDLAGNFSVVATNTVTVTGSNVSANDALYDVMFAGVDADATDGAEFVFSNSNTAADNTSNDDSTGKLVLDIDDASEGDTVELWADGQKVFSAELTATNISDGQLSTDEIDFVTADAAATSTGTASDEKVLLEVKVKHGDQYVQDSGDTTWEYQW